METTEPGLKPRLIRCSLISLSPVSLVTIPESPADDIAIGTPPLQGAGPSHSDTIPGIHLWLQALHPLQSMIFRDT